VIIKTVQEKVAKQQEQEQQQKLNNNEEMAHMIVTSCNTTILTECIKFSCFRIVFGIGEI
jgi:hypothetical protein